MSGSVPRFGLKSFLQFLFLGFWALAACAALGPLVVLPLAWKEQAIFGAVLIGFAMLLNAVSRSLATTVLLMAVSVFSTLRYGYWRVVQTWDGVNSAGHIHRWDTAFVLLLLLAEFFAFATLILGYFQTLRPLKRPPLPLEGDPATWPTVDVLIPTYNEPLHVVKGTVLAAAALDYPAEKIRVLLLDDGRREEFREFAAQAGVEYMTRDNNAHAKAGNINHALTQISGDFVAIFDCDHVPVRSFLKTTLGWFLRDRDLGLVQTPHHFYSPDPFERNLGQFRKVPNEGELFHRLVQDGNDLWNASFFCGSCAVLRRSALDEIGGIAVETVTEDAHTALRLQRRGWNTAYINLPRAAGLATESLAAHIGQRIRWARGMTQILRTENPLFASGLSLSQRLCYFNATTHFLFAIPRLIFLTVPLVYLLFGKVNIYGYTWAVVAYAIPHIVLSNLTNSRVQGRHRHSFWNEVYEVVLAPYILFPTLLALINPKLGKFNVTSKGGVLRRSYFDRRIAFPYILLLALNVAGLVRGEQRYFADPGHRDTILMNAAWTLYNTMILSVATSVAWERRRLRSGACIRARIPALLKVDSDPSFEFEGPVEGDTLQVSPTAVALKLEHSLELARGAPVLLVLGEGRAACTIPALVAHSAGKLQHLFLPELTEQQEDQIEFLLRGNRRAWRKLRQGQAGDRPLRSLLQILFLGVRGLALLPIGFLTPRPSDDDEPLPPRRRKSATSIAVPAVLLAALLLVHGSRAQNASRRSRTDASQAQTQPANFHDEVQLGQANGTTTLTLPRSGASLSFFFGEPVTKVATSAVLKLGYAAPDLRPNEARLAVTLNGAEVGSIPLVPGTAQQAEFPLPTDLLTSDSTLALELQGTCESCVGGSRPWVVLSPSSSISLSGTRLPIGNDLSLLPLPFFDPAGRGSWSLPVVFGETPDNVTLQSAALLASWFGVLSDVRGAHFPVSVGEIPSGNAVLFALRRSSLLAGLALSSARGPLIAMRENPRDPYGKLLIITGDSPDDLLQAARALTSAKWIPHVTTVQAHAVPMTPQAAYAAPRWLQTDHPSQIGAYTTAERLKLQGTGSINLYFRLPPDLFLRAHQSVPLLLKFKYGGAPNGTRPAVSVRLNGKDIDSMQLNPASAPVQESETFRLPTGSMLPYTNTLTVDFYFASNTPPADVRPSFAVSRDSTIDLHELPHSVVLPRLELFADAGYPFTEWPDGSRAAVIMPDAPTPVDIETLLDMTGFWGGQTGSLATGLEIAESAGVKRMRGKDLVLIGTPQSQPLLSEWADAMPLDMSAPATQVHQAPETTLLLRPQWPFRESDGDRLTSLLNGDVSGVGLFVESFVSPLHPDRAVVAIVPHGSGAADAVRGLFTPSERQGPVYGGVAVSQDGRFQSFLTGTAAYHAGRFNQYQYATVLLFENYRILPLFVLFLSLFIAAWVRWSTERVAARRLAPWVSNRG
ncbi:MAG TPA: UDP-forming cellulose synthase catalytic subunit [Acidobacteriaceae bacterium]|nr:UDP-forming cellulose synthase catalytic subunit [Acidobacteriaceae bacterium]